MAATPTHSLDEWSRLAAGLEPRRQALIDGELVDAASGETFESVNPATGATLAEVAAGDAEDIDRAVRSARAAFERGSWSEAAPEERKRILLRLAGLISEHRDELALLDSLDMGKPVEDAATVDVPGAAGVFQWYGEAIDKLYDEIAPTAPGDLALITREPLGVVGAVVPWNFPLDMASWKLAPALACGNASSSSPPSSRRCRRSCSASWRSKRDCRRACSTSSRASARPPAGRSACMPTSTASPSPVRRRSASSFSPTAAESNAKPVWLECGGKSPNLVFADSEDLDAAADMAAFGIFYNQGEVCSANSRLLVESSIRDEFVEKIVERARGARIGDPLDPETTMGPLVDEDHTARVMSYVEEGRRRAASGSVGSG